MHISCVLDSSDSALSFPLTCICNRTHLRWQALCVSFHALVGHSSYAFFYTDLKFTLMLFSHAWNWDYTSICCLWQVLDSLTHHWLSTSNAHFQHSCCDGACCCQVPEYAQGSDLWNKCRQVSWACVKRVVVFRV